MYIRKSKNTFFFIEKSWQKKLIKLKCLIRLNYLKPFKIIIKSKTKQTLTKCDQKPIHIFKIYALTKKFI